MQTTWGGHEFTSAHFDDAVAGCAGLKLMKDGVIVAQVTFWDAVGQYFIETFGGDLPLELVERLIAEVKVRVPTG